jgi:autotransporter-associated beta strand protein
MSLLKEATREQKEQAMRQGNSRQTKETFVRNFKLSLAVAAAMAIALAAVATPAQAATLYWSGTNTWDWNNTQDWGTVTGGGGTYNAAKWTSGADTATFEGTGGAVTVSGIIPVSVINFTAPAGGYTLSGGNLFLGSAITNTTGTNVINSPLFLTANSTVTNTAGSLTLGGDINNLGYQLTATATNALTIGGSIYGGGALVKGGANPLTLSSANPFLTGATSFSAGAGRIILGNTDTLLASTVTTTNATNGLDFGALTAATIGGLAGTANQTLLNNNGAGTAVNLTVGYNNTAQTYSAALSGALGGLTKIGTGVQTLTPAANAPHSYTGNTEVDGGTLTLSLASQNTTYVDYINASSSLVLRGGNFTFTPKAAVANRQTFAGTTLNAGASTAAVTTIASGSGELRLNGITRNVGSTINFTPTANTTITTDTSNDVASNGIMGGWAVVNNTDWAVSAASAADTAVTALAAGSYTTQNSAALWAAGQHLTNSAAYSGTTTSNLSIASLRFNSANVSTVAIGDTLTIDSGGILETSTVAANIQTILGGTLKGAAGTDLVIHQGVNTNKLTIASIIANNGGATGLTMSGLGILTLLGANAYTGPTTINAGTLSVGADNNLGNANSLVFAGGTLQVTGVALNSYAAGSIGTHAVTQTANALIGLDIDNFANTFTVSTALAQGAGGLTKRGAGTVVLSGVNTYDGATTVSVGTLKAGVASVANVSGAFGRNSAVTLANTVGATLDLGGYDNQIGSLTGGGTTGGNVTLGAKTLTIGSDNTSPAAYAGIISGAGGSIVKVGSGTLTLSGPNTFTGGVTLSAGTLTLGNPTALGATPGGLTINRGGILNASAATVMGNNNPLTINTDFTFTGSAALGLGTGTVSLGTTPGPSRTITVSGNTLTLGGVISNGTDGTTPAISLIKAGAGALVLSGANGYTGTTTITTGSLRAADGTGLPTNSALIINGGQLETSGSVARTTGTGAGNVRWAATGGFSAYNGALTVTLNGGAALDWSDVNGLNGQTPIFNTTASDNVVTLASGLDLKGVARTITVNDNTATAADYAVISGAISNSGAAATLTKNGAGTLALTNVANNGYTGTTIITAGALRAADGTTLPGGLLQFNGGVLEASGTFNRSIGSAAGTVQWNADGGFAAQGGALAVNLNGGSLGVDWAAAIGTGLNGKNLIFGSVTADSVVTLTNGLDMKNAARSITVNDNITTAADYAEISGAISNSTGNNTQALTKAGAGTLVLSGTSSYPGATTVSAGVLSVSNLQNAGVNSNLGAFAAAGAGGISLNGGTLRYTGASGVSVDRGFTLAATSTVDVNRDANTLTLGASSLGAFTLNVIGGAGSSLGLGATTLTGAATLNPTTASLSVASVTSAAAQNLTLGGTSTGNTVSGAITTLAGTLTKSGIGTWTLGGANTYTGATTVSAGVLSVSNLQNAGVNSNLGAFAAAGAAGLTLSGGTLQYTGATAGTDRGFTLSGNSKIDVSTTGATLTLGASSLGAFTLNVTGGGPTSVLALGATTLTGAATLYPTTANMTVASVTSAAAQNLTLGGTSTGNTVGAITTLAGTVTKTGGGTWALTGANSYTGATIVGSTPSAGIVQGGTLLLDMNAGGSLNTASALTLSGGNFEIKGKTGAFDTAQTMGILTLSEKTANKIAINANGGTSTTLTLGAAWARSYGASVLFDYTNSNAASFVKTATGVSTAGGNTAQGNAIQAGLSNGIFGYALVKEFGTGLIGFAKQDASFNIVRYDDTTGTTLANNSSSVTTNYTTLGTTYSDGNSGTFSWTGVGSRSVNSLTIDTTTNYGTIDMGAAANVLSINSGGILFKGVNDATLTGGHLSSGPGASSPEVIIHQTSTTNTLTINSPYDSFLDAYGIALSYGHPGSLAKDGDGTLVLGGANTYGRYNGYGGPARTTVNAGTLRAGVASVLYTSGPFGVNTFVTLANVAGATLDANNFDIAIGALAGGGAIGGNVTLGTGALTLGGGNQTGVYAGVISSTGTPTTSLIKIGTGTQTLTGANTYTGATSVNKGTLLLGGTAGALTGTTAVTVTGGATLTDGDSTTFYNNGVNNRINSAATLILGGGSAWDNAWGGTFAVAAPAVGSISQSLASLTVAAGTSTIQGTVGTATLNLTGSGASVYTRNAGGVVNFASAMTTFTNAPSTNISAGTVGAAGTGLDTILVGAFLNNADFVKAGAGVITPVAAYAYDTQDNPANWGTAAGNDGIITSALLSGTTRPGAVSINALRTTSAGAINIGTGDANSLSIASGMILHTPASVLTINGPGSLTSGNGQDLVLNVVSSSGAVTVNAPITGSIGLTKVGAGILSLTSTASNFSGNIYPHAGTLDFNPTGAAAYANTVSGLGAITKSGPNAVTLSGPVSLGGTFTVNADGGTANLTNTNIIGGAVTVRNAGTLNLTGPTSIGSTVTVNGGGTLQWSSAFNAPATTASTITVGSNGVGRAVASITIPAGTVLYTSSLSVGADGTGNGGSPAGHELTISGSGTMDLQSGSISLGGNSATGGGTGTLNISGDGNLVIRSGYQSHFDPGQGLGSVGYFNLSGATVNFVYPQVWGGSGGSVIAYQTSGTMTVQNVGISGVGTSSYTITGGTLSLSSGTVCSDSTAAVNVLGSGAVTSGALVVGNASTAGRTGTLNIAGNGTVTASTSVSIGAKTTATGVVNLAGGTLSVPGAGIFGTAGGSSTLNLSGGTIKYTGNSTADSWMKTLTNAYVYPSGVTINSNGYSGTISQVLKPATGKGVTGITLTNAGGTGYTAAPAVSFTGGVLAPGGSEAQAVATFDRSTTGKVTGIVIVNPGQYTTLPTAVTFSRQAGELDTWTTAATASISGTASNAGGGLTKTGTGTLTLSGINTYTGDTTVSAGGLTLADNAGLTFVIGDNGVNNKITGAGTLTLAGDFTFDLTGANSTGGNQWMIVDVGSLAETFLGTFEVVNFTDAGGDTWTKTINATKYYEFKEATGILTVIQTVVPGDTNSDNVVDPADYIAMKQNFGLTGGATLGQGDVDSDSDVDWDDLQVLMTNFGAGTFTTPATTPEPATLGLLAIGALAVIRRRRRKA